MFTTQLALRSNFAQKREGLPVCVSFSANSGWVDSSLSSRQPHDSAFITATEQQVSQLNHERSKCRKHRNKNSAHKKSHLVHFHLKWNTQVTPLSPTYSADFVEVQISRMGLIEQYQQLQIWSGVYRAAGKHRIKIHTNFSGLSCLRANTSWIQTLPSHTRQFEVNWHKRPPRAQRVLNPHRKSRRTAGSCRPTPLVSFLTVTLNRQRPRRRHLTPLYTLPLYTRSAAAEKIYAPHPVLVPDQNRMPLWNIIISL